MLTANSMPHSNDPILREIRARLERLYGNRLARVVLFGSRARGEAQPDSDYDVAIFLRDLEDRWAEFDRMSGDVRDMLYEQGAFVQAMPFPESRYEEASPLMIEIRRDGVEL